MGGHNSLAARGEINWFEGVLQPVYTVLGRRTAFEYLNMGSYFSCDTTPITNSLKGPEWGFFHSTLSTNITNLDESTAELHAIFPRAGFVLGIWNRSYCFKLVV